MKIPYRKLQAARLIAPSKDIRYYLNGVLVEFDCLVATDGHRLIKIPFKADADTADTGSFIIPADAIDRLHKQLTPKQRRLADVFIYTDKLECQDAITLYKPIDGEFPDYKRVIPKEKHEEDREQHSRFNWEYMSDFAKIDKILHGTCKLNEVDMYPDGTNSCLVKFARSPDVVGVIMPMQK